jgi:hypothetical protein
LLNFIVVPVEWLKIETTPLALLSFNICNGLFKVMTPKFVFDSKFTSTFSITTAVIQKVGLGYG